jgi:hypothetical protein
LPLTDDFDVSIFLRESGTRHSVVTRQKTFKDQAQEVANANANELAGWGDSPIHVADESDPTVSVLVESDEEPQINLRDIPDAAGGVEDDQPPKRRRQPRGTGVQTPDDGSPSSKRKKAELSSVTLGTEDQKKLSLQTVYEGFSIWGWVLCLLITRKAGKARDGKAAAGLTGSALMEEWISTQALQDYEG